MLLSRSNFGYADQPAGRTFGRFGTAAELWCDEWMEWVERLESEVEETLKPSEEKQDHSDGDDGDDEDEEEDPDGAEFEIAWLIARFETGWSAAKQLSKRTSLIAKYGEHFRRRVFYYGENSGLIFKSVGRNFSSSRTCARALRASERYRSGAAACSTGCAAETTVDGTAQ